MSESSTRLSHLEIYFFKMGPKKQSDQRKKLFLPGNKPWNRGLKVEEGKTPPKTKYARLTREDLSRTVVRDKFGNFLHHPEENVSQSSPIMLLRPKTGEDLVPLEKMLTSPTGSATGHRIVDFERLTGAINEASRQHTLSSPGCTNMEWSIPEKTEEIRGVAVTAKFKCINCEFQSTAQKFYKEILRSGPGRRTAVPNMALQVGLYQSSIANTAATRVLTAMSIPAGSMSSLQSMANKCGKVMTASNEVDMAAKRMKVKDILEYRGMDRETPINVEIDRQYNIPLSHAKGKTPFAPATQARDVVAENVTPDKFIVAYNSTNKLCRFGQQQVRQGKDPSCPNHPKCTATIKLSDNIGDEMLGGQKCAKKLLTRDETQLIVKGVISDSDGHFHRGMTEVMKREAGVEPTSYLCVTHLKRSLSRKLEKLSLSKNAFPGKTARLRNKQQRAMAGDISHRVQAELTAAYQRSPDILVYEEQLVNCGEAILVCYAGNHQLCRSHSLVCKGSYKFPFLPIEYRQRITLNSKDQQQILQAIRHRLSPSMLRRTRLHSSTQKAESMNSAFRVTYPKHTTTYARNHENREHSAIQLTNSGPASILHKASAAQVPLEGGIRLKRQLQCLQGRRNYWKQRSKKQTTKLSKAVHRGYKYKLYQQVNKWKDDSNFHSYVKGQLESSNLSISSDHPYDRNISGDDDDNDDAR